MTKRNLLKTLAATGIVALASGCASTTSYDVKSEESMATERKIREYKDQGYIPIGKYFMIPADYSYSTSF